MSPPIRSSKYRDRFTYNILEPRRVLASAVDLVIPALPESNYFLENAKQESVAREYVAANTDVAILESGFIDLELVEIQHGLATTVTRFQQTIQGIPVVDAYVTTIQGPDGDFLLIHDQRFRGTIGDATPQRLIDFSATEKVALEFAGAYSTFAPSRGELVWLPGQNNVAAQVWQMTVFGVTPETHGDFLTFVDVETGKVLSQENRISHLNGTGKVFFPNPYQTQGSGTDLTDRGDANNTALSNQRVSVTLEGLDSGTGFLNGEFVNLSSLNSPNLTDVDANEPTRNYDYTRDDDRFEQVVIYHTVDQINRYFHLLGFDDDAGVANGIRDFATLANAHWYTSDNAFYSTGDDAIHFGDGGVDDGEDGDVIAHEYGHAVQHDQNASWGGGEMGAMGEGFGDYLAASFFQTVGDSTYLSNHAAAVAEWDAVSYSSANPPNLRRVDGNKVYPVDLNGEVHSDGEIWSRALWDINQTVGSAVADRIILESHFMLPANSSMVTAAEMILLADQNINSGANASVIRQAFEDRGILEPPETIGTVTLDKSVYSVGDMITITVKDGNGPATIPVSITSSNGDSESLTLTGNSGVYIGMLTTIAGTPTAGDSQLQAALGDTFTVTYQDADDGNGNGVTATDTGVFADVTEYTANDVPINITDNTTIRSTITVPDSGNLLDIDLQLNITHTWDGDLTGILTAPNGEQITLFARIGSSGNDYADTLFDDDASQSISNGSPPYSGVFRPAESFAALDGISITGDWILSITDSANLDTGKLNSWSLFITVEPNPSIGPVTDANGANDQVAENAAIGSTVGITASAADPGDTVTYELTDNAGGRFEINTNSGVVTVAGMLDYETAISHLIDVKATSSDGTFSLKTFSIAISNVNDAVIRTRQLFYDNSSFDGSDNFDAVATDKQFLVEGQSAKFENYSSYWLGINGLALEVNDLNTTPTLASIGNFFAFKVGNDDTPGDWATAPAPSSVVFQENVDIIGTDRVFLTWNDNAIENEWLQITVLSGAVSGLAAPDVFYFGSVIGETGNDPSNAIVNGLDLAFTRFNQTGFGSSDIDNDYDFNRDGRVNGIDIAIARANQSGFTVVKLITPGANKNKGISIPSQFNSVSDSATDSKVDQAIELDQRKRQKQLVEPGLTTSLTLIGSQVDDKRPLVTLASTDRVDDLSGERTKLNFSLDNVFEKFDIPLI